MTRLLDINYLFGKTEKTTEGDEEVCVNTMKNFDFVSAMTTTNPYVSNCVVVLCVKLRSEHPGMLSLSLDCTQKSRGKDTEKEKEKEGYSCWVSAYLFEHHIGSSEGVVLKRPKFTEAFLQYGGADEVV